MPDSRLPPPIAAISVALFAALGARATVLEGYTGLKYIESTGTQWIDTMVVPNANTEIVTQYQLTAMPTEVDLRGMDAIEAVCVLERYLDEAMRANLPSVRIIHGKGTGALRAAVQQSLKKNKFIKNFRLGQYGEGEDGVTIAEFR